MVATDDWRLTARYLRSVIVSFVVEWNSLVTCPSCGDQREQRMPEFSCLPVYTCPVCQTVLRPAAGDCCIFCTYGSVPCPAIQEQRWTGGAGRLP